MAGSVTIPDAIEEFRNRVLASSSKRITIEQALGRSFDYNDLMTAGLHDAAAWDAKRVKP